MSRRLLVVAFVDLVDWTGLGSRIDPEPLKHALERYYEICSVAVQGHGGVLEKFIGDAVMAVFGASTSREDDVARATRAVLEIQSAVFAMDAPDTAIDGLRIHAGIAAGEALVKQSQHAGLRIVGDVVNLAARLQSAAVPNEVLLNDIAVQLGADELEVAPVAPLRLPGRSEPVTAARVIDVRAPRDDDREPTTMVDRTVERAKLAAAFDDVVRARRARRVTVLGPPGIGKSRLVAEAFDAGCTVSCHCPSYGPNANAVQIAGFLDGLLSTSAGSRRRLRGDRRLNGVLNSLRSARADSSDRSAGADPGPGIEEATWVTRELLLAACAEPLVLVWDGLDLAGSTVVSLLESIFDTVREHPVLIVRVARSPQGAWNARPDARDEVLEVGALSPEHGAELIETMVAADPEDRGRLDAAELAQICADGAGNPLLLRLLLEAASPGSPRDTVPPTVTALIGAMIDRLPPLAGLVLGAASALGNTFTLDQLSQLVEGSDARRGLDALVVRRLVRPADRGTRYVFVQHLVHEVAYARLDKEQRLEWHLHLAQAEFDPAFHLEAALQLLVDLRPADPDIAGLAERAADALLQEGSVLLSQRDVTGALEMLGRALELAPPDPSARRAVIAVRLSDALVLSGDIEQALAVVCRADEDADGSDLCATQRHILELRLNRVGGDDAERLLAGFDCDPSDHLAWCRYDQLRMLLYLKRGRFASAEQAGLRALAHAEAADDWYEQGRLQLALCEVEQWSPAPIVDKLARSATLVTRFARDRVQLVPVLTARARHLALGGELDAARVALAEAESIVGQLRLPLGQVLVDQTAGLVCALEGAHEAAEQQYSHAAEALEQAGLASAALALRVESARERARYGNTPAAAAELALLLQRKAEMTLPTRIVLLAAAARHSVGEDAPGGLFGQARSLIDEALVLLAETDDPCLDGDVRTELAATLDELGDDTAAREMAAAALNSYAVVGVSHVAGSPGGVELR